MISKKRISKDLEILNPKETEHIFPKEEIQILFLNNGVEKSVEAYEANSLPCSKIIERLNRGESVFISKKTSQLEPKINFDHTENSLYLTRI